MEKEITIGENNYVLSNERIEKNDPYVILIPKKFSKVWYDNVSDIAFGGGIRMKIISTDNDSIKEGSILKVYQKGW